jgi:L-lactate dehydrogenase (cytochrome)
MFDSGIRSGQDVLKAIALGAKGTMIGRAYTYGLGANGEQGVTDALRVIHKELDTTMGLCGQTRMSDITQEILMVPDGFHRK